MYKQISIKNLKTFEDEQKLNIAPLTLIYGENSSGKTTLLKALDIIHNIFLQRSISMTKIITGSGIIEDIKNISSRKIHFFSSRINKKPIQIELKLNLPFRDINKDHSLYSSEISEQYEYFEKKTLPKSGQPKKTISRKTIGPSTYITDEMPDGSLRKMVIRDTGERVGKQKKFQISLLGSSKIFKSKDKIKMLPAKFLIEIKYFPGLKLSKINKLEIKDVNNKTLINFSRISRQYNFIKDKNQYGYIKGAPKENLRRNIKENPDFFTSSAGYADYRINVTKDNNIWLRAYKKYEKIFSDNKKISERLNKTRLLFKTLNRFKYSLLARRGMDGDGLNINWNGFSELVSTYVLSNNKTSYLEMEKTLNNLFIFSNKNFPKKTNFENIRLLLEEQTDMEIMDDGEIAWEGHGRDDYFTSKILKKHLYARKYWEEILAFSSTIKNARHSDFFTIENLLNKKVSFKKFCVACRNSYQDYFIRFKRTANMVGMGSYAEIKHEFVNSLGKAQYTNIDIFISFLEYIYGDIPNLFKYYKDDIKFEEYKQGLGSAIQSRLKFERSIKRILLPQRISPHFLIINCITEIRKTIEGFVACHPNKSETSYDVPMAEEFHLDEIQKAIGSIYDHRYLHTKKIKSFLKTKGINYKEITVDTSQKELENLTIEFDGHKIIEKLYKNCKIQREYHFDEIGYVADYYITDKNNKKTVVEVRTSVWKGKRRQERDFVSQPEAISANGDNFDQVICNNNKLRKELNKILKPLLNLKIIVVTPEWLKNISGDTYDRLSKGWDRGSFRNLWNLRRKWPTKDKFIMLQDLNYKKFFNIHGREVGKGPSNILPFLAQLLSKKPNLIYLIQELENNWHPKIQGKIVKAIAEIMMQSENKNFILETHSELFILQIQKLVQKGILKKEDVSINYISRSKKGNSEVHYIPLNSQGGFEKPWPGGFFNERMEVLTS